MRKCYPPKLDRARPTPLQLDYCDPDTTKEAPKDRGPFHSLIALLVQTAIGGICALLAGRGSLFTILLLPLAGIALSLAGATMAVVPLIRGRSFGRLNWLFAVTLCLNLVALAACVSPIADLIDYFHP